MNTSKNNLNKIKRQNPDNYKNTFFQKVFTKNDEAEQSVNKKAEKLLKGTNRHIKEHIEDILVSKYNYDLFKFDEEFIQPIDSIVLLENLDESIDEILISHTYEDISEYLVKKLEKMINGLNLYNQQSFQFYIKGLSIVKMNDYAPFKESEVYDKLKDCYALRLTIMTNILSREYAGYTGE